MNPIYTRTLLVSSSSSSFRPPPPLHDSHFHHPTPPLSYISHPSRLPLLRPRKMMNMQNQTRKVNAAKPQQTPTKDSQEVRNCLSQIQLKVKNKTRPQAKRDVLLLGAFPLGFLASVSVRGNILDGVTVNTI
ncbi:hypothetical protein E2C01_002663 [Portunus trituberculatus]|uniref:Uncharacterized protein n=1 Tax=Portunus trituberculatus TaxID=210409 RepID=A0A5B7CLU4_PORTR|nr:hypothetical protein [Portunus trituberculatus]